MQVLLPEDVSEVVKANLRMGLPHSPMMAGLLQSSQLRDCCITAVPGEWYTNEPERERGGKEEEEEKVGEKEKQKLFKDTHFHQRYMLFVVG